MELGDTSGEGSHNNGTKQIEAQIQMLQSQLQLLSTELAQLVADKTGGATAPIDSTAPATQATAPIDSTAPATTPPAAAANQYAATGPNGDAVGSTATAFGPGAMPADTAAANAQYYVSPDGSTSGDGSQSNPFATLQQAANAMATSDIKTTDVESGTYDQSTGLTLTSADSGESFISNGSATLDGGGSTGDMIAVNGANDVSIEGLNMTNTANNPVWSSSDWLGANSGEDAIFAQNTSGDNFSYNNISNVGIAMNLQSASGVQADGNDINNVQQAVVAAPGSSGNTIDSNLITNVNDVTGVANNNQGAINLVGDSNDSVVNNVIQNTTAAGIEVTTVTTGDTVSQNTVENTNTAATPSSTYNASATNPADMGAIYAWAGVGNTKNDQLTISDNYVQNAGLGFENNGIYLDDGVSGATITGNIVDAAGAGGASYDLLVHGGSNNNIANNVFNLDSASGKEQGVFIQSDGPAMTGNNLTDNTFYASGTNGGAETDDIASASDIPTMSGNDYYGVSVPSVDAQGVTNNPGFYAADSGNYSPTSLAAQSSADSVVSPAPSPQPDSTVAPVTDSTTSAAATASPSLADNAAPAPPNEVQTTPNTAVAAPAPIDGATIAGGSTSSEIGFYGGAGSPTLAEQTSATLGRPVAVTDYLDMTQPADQTVNWVTSQYSAWQAANPDTPIILGVPLTFQSQTLQQTASGSNNQKFVDIAQQLVNAGMGNANIRLGWEMNGTWYPWGGDPTDYISAYNNAAEAMKSVPGADFTFTWNVSNGSSGPYPFQDYYPGGQNVNVIGDDAYDNTGNAQSVITETGGLQDVANFAQQQGKPFAVPEWGLWNSSGDDPAYINDMAQFFTTVPDLAYQSYYGDGSTTPLLSAEPQSQAAYNQDFSS